MKLFATSTPVPPTATSTATSTPVPPTATPTPPVGTCAAISQNGWIAAASTSYSNYLPANAIDGNPNTRWTAGQSQVAGTYFMVDMDSVQTFNQIVMNNANEPNDSPAAFDVFVSTDGANFGNAVTSATGVTGSTTVQLGTQTARYIKIVLRVNASNWWSIDEFNVFYCGTYFTPTPVPPTATATNTPVSPTTTALALRNLSANLRWEQGWQAIKAELLSQKQAHRQARGLERKLARERTKAKLEMEQLGESQVEPSTPTPTSAVCGPVVGAGAVGAKEAYKPAPNHPWPWRKMTYGRAKYQINPNFVNAKN